MNSGEAYISLAAYVPGQAKRDGFGLSRSHSFAPVIGRFAGGQWRQAPEGIFTHVRPGVELPQNGETFKIRVSAHPAIADDVLEEALPIIIQAGAPFKVISNSALLEFVCAKSYAEGPDGDFLIIYPRTKESFTELVTKLQRAVEDFRNPNLALPLPETAQRKPLSTDSPWPGLEHYAPSDAPYFFGRKDEALELAHRVKQGVVTVAMGEPGVGKTSLLCAGLKPHFDELSYEPVYLRLRFGSDVHPVQQIRDEINSVLSERQISGAPFAEDKTLWEYFRLQKSVWLSPSRKPVVPVLILDQFEDVFAFHGANLVVREEVEAFWTQISALAENRIPATVRQLDLPFPDLRREREVFKLVLGLRVEHLQKLLSRRGQMPSLGQNHFVLYAMNGRKGVEAILGPGRPLFDATAEAQAPRIVRHIAKEIAPSQPKSSASAESFEPIERLRVEPALLSFFCERLNDARKRARELHPEAKFITATLFDRMAEGILDEFFARTKMARNPAAMPPPAPVEQKARGERADSKPLALPEEEAPSQPRTPLLLGEGKTHRRRDLVFGLAILVIILLPIIGVIYFEELERGKTEQQLKAYASRLAVGQDAVAAANLKLVMAETNLALQKSNLLQLAEQVRAREQEVRNAMAQNMKLAGEETNIQSRADALAAEKSQDEARLIQYRNFLLDLTNQVTALNQQNQKLAARANSLAASNLALVISNSLAISNATLAASNAVKMSIAKAAPPPAAASVAAPVAPTLTPTTTAAPAVAPPVARAAPPLASNVNNTTPAPVGEPIADTPAPAAEPESDDSLGPNLVSVIGLRGLCYYSREGARFHGLDRHRTLLRGSVVQTGKKSSVDLFIPRAGTTIRVAPDSQVKFARLTTTAKDGVPVSQTVVEVDQGRVFAVIRAMSRGSSVVIQNVDGSSELDCHSVGGYMINSPGTNAAEKLAMIPLGVVTPKGTVTEAAGQDYHTTNVVALSLVPAAWETVLSQLDEIESETDHALADLPSQATTKN